MGIDLRVFSVIHAVAAVTYHHPVVGTEIHRIFPVAFDYMMDFKVIFASTDYAPVVLTQKVSCPGLKFPVGLSRMDFLI